MKQPWLINGGDPNYLQVLGWPPLSILPSYMGIIMDHYKDPSRKQPRFHRKSPAGFLGRG